MAEENNEVYSIDKIREIATRLRDPNAVAQNTPEAVATLAILVEEACLYIAASEARMMKFIENAAEVIGENGKKALAGVVMLKNMIETTPAAAPAAEGAAAATPTTGAVAPKANGKKKPGPVPTPANVVAESPGEMIRNKDGSMTTQEDAVAFVMGGVPKGS